MAPAEPPPPTLAGPDAPGDAEAVLQRVREPGYLDGLAARPNEWIRAERTAITAVEDGISYVRRVVQGRLDIVTAERDRRRDGTEHDLSSLIERLPAILAERVHAPGLGRLNAVLEPGEIIPELSRRMQEATPDRLLTRVTEASDDDLAAATERLGALEQHVSQLRRSCHEALDGLVAEVVRRYRDGEADVDNLLR